MIDHKYYNKEFLYNYFQGSSKLFEVQQAEEKSLTMLYSSAGLRSLSNVVHLDIGTCTGRYLLWALNKDCKNIYGLDKSIDSINFCTKYIKSPSNFIHGCCSFENSYKDISNIGSSTMMLGTFCHLNDLQKISFVTILKGKMISQGVIAISLWNKPPYDLGIYNSKEAEYLYNESYKFKDSLFEFNDFKLIDSNESEYTIVKLFKKK